MASLNGRDNLTRLNQRTELNISSRTLTFLGFAISKLLRPDGDGDQQRDTINCGHLDCDGSEVTNSSGERCLDSVAETRAQLLNHDLQICERSPDAKWIHNLLNPVPALIANQNRDVPPRHSHRVMIA